MKTKLLTLVGLCMIVFQACNSEQEPPVKIMVQNEPQISHLVIKYEGKIYETDVKVIGDSVTYLNSEYAEIFNSKISNNPKIAAIISTDEKGINYVEYFSSERNLLENYAFIEAGESQENIEPISTRSKIIDMWPANNTATILGIAHIFDDKNYSDTELVTYATNLWSTSIPKLTDIGFNDKASSIRVKNTMNKDTIYRIISKDENGTTQYNNYKGDQLRPVLVCYHNSNYTGTVLYCIAPPTGNNTEHEDENLKGIGWNDRISSTTWMIVSDFSLFNGENPVIPSHKDC